MINEFIKEISDNKNLTAEDKVERFLFLKNLLISYDENNAGIIDLENEMISLGFCPDCGGELVVAPYDEIHDEVDYMKTEKMYRTFCERCGKEIY